MAAEFPGEDTHLCNAYLYGLFVRSLLTLPAMVVQCQGSWKSGESWLISMILEIILTLEHPNATGALIEFNTLPICC
jgi:hypothetical protein